ncbi:hypothetical protein FOZ62_010432, partial [Perkinsus olseni]
EVGLTPEVYSDSNKTILAIKRPHVAEVSHDSGPFLGGNVLTLHGTGFWNSQAATEANSLLTDTLYVIIGDTPVPAWSASINGTVATVRVPAVPHFTGSPAKFELSLTHNLQDRLFTGLLESGGTAAEVLKEYEYLDVAIGKFYRPEIHQDGAPKDCPQGSPHPAPRVTIKIIPATGHVTFARSDPGVIPTPLLLRGSVQMGTYVGERRAMTKTSHCVRKA